MNKRQEIYENGTLILRDLVKPDDAGVYTCSSASTISSASESTDAVRSDLVSASIQITVLRKYRWSENYYFFFSFTLQLKDEEEATKKCCFFLYSRILSIHHFLMHSSLFSRNNRHVTSVLNVDFRATQPFTLWHRGDKSVQWCL